VADWFARVFADAFLVYTVGPTGKDKDRFAARFPLENQRFDDLAKLASSAFRSFLRGARGLGMFDNGEIIAERAKGILYFLGGRRKYGHAPNYSRLSNV
jgi:hypothetical protein